MKRTSLILLALCMSMTACGGQASPNREGLDELEAYGSKRICDRIKARKNCLAAIHCAWEAEPVCAALATSPEAPCEPYCYKKTKEDTCSDGTSYGQCQADGPMFCDGTGKLTEDCLQCPVCPGSQTCNADTGRCEKKTPAKRCPATCPRNQLCDPFSGHACVPVKGESHYVDFGTKVPLAQQEGTFSRPWSTIAQIKSHAFKEGDDLFFRTGTTKAVAQKLVVNWDGTETNRAIIGAYHGEGLFGLGGQDRPVLKGSFRSSGANVPPGDYDGLITYNRPGGYITVRDLELVESYAAGVKISSGHDGSIQQVEVSNCVVRDIGRQGISFGSTHHSLIEGNHVEQVCQRKVVLAIKTTYSGAAIVIMGGNSETKSMHNTIRGNTVARYFEGIGVYRGPRYTVVEDNTVYDGSDMGIYISNARDAVVRNNLVYNPPVIWHSLYKGPGARNGIQLDSEGHRDKVIKLAGNHEVHDNFIAGMTRGIVLASRSNALGVWQKNNRIHDNVIVDCESNIALAKSKTETMADVAGWENNLISNNASFVFTGGMQHTNVKTWPGVAWDGNYFNTAVSGDPAHNAQINKVKLKNTSGWRDLTPGDLDRSDFDFE